MRRSSGRRDDSPDAGHQARQHISALRSDSYAHKKAARPDGLGSSRDACGRGAGAAQGAAAVGKVRIATLAPGSVGCPLMSANAAFHKGFQNLGYDPLPVIEFAVLLRPP